MRNYGRSLEKIKGERRITVFFLCDHCKVEVLVSRPARPYFARPVKPWAIMSIL